MFRNALIQEAGVFIADWTHEQIWHAETISKTTNGKREKETGKRNKKTNKQKTKRKMQTD